MAVEEQQETAQVIPFRAPARDPMQVKVEYLMGVMFEYGYGVEADIQEALRWYRAAAEQGLPQAQNSLGFMYSIGLGVKCDAERAAHWLQLAAEQGHSGAQTNLGILYTSGRGVEKDEEEAVYWFRTAARNGNTQAQELLAGAYSKGWYGLPRDSLQADFWRQRTTG
ncbi:tetratricopeptide repeat protein [Sulfuriflexus sp.]|uniref:tetratricopeptide repeat protein n=1 Tax=Sulfuriflexus sp. TaxID=2015443 RepID=UPI0028CDA4CA|nr:tetratricopeptide repeat protein [Sulfuriflexus sp.]MDT8404546.1 tetratricopeptide repeat protein [Sulfuriflexus sp.]